ncbi:hypothetical protein HPP92_007264 [Vanilla planifolia]|uniref:Protein DETOXIFICATION n=1 Tax=Vanilla planifolia TaxID=51239 RepID=A0A835V8I9_VANPL|nr:hypothetical protein HPP92_007264 [Vanilla planifolia]
MADIRRTILTEMKKQKSIILPLIPTNSTWFAKTAITTAFLGRLGELELAAGTLGFAFANVTGISILTGLCWAMEPICGQAHGAKNRRLLHRTLLMTVILMLVASLPISFVWFFVDRILLLFGQQRDMALLAKRYVFYLFPDLWATSFLSPLKAYYSSQGITLPTIVSAALAVGFHVPFIVFLSRTKGIGGVALAVGLSDIVEVVALGAYLFFTESWKGADSGGWWEHRASEWLRLLRLSAQCCFSFCLEWWNYEILVLLAGRLPEAQRAVAVLTIVLNFDYLLYGFMISIATCASTRVANELGAGEPRASQTAACVSIFFSAAAGFAGGGLIFAFRGSWGRLFSRDGGVVAGVKRTLPLMAVFEVFSFPLGASGGVVRGTTRPWLGMWSVGGFYLVGLPLAAGLGFGKGYGLCGLLLGFVAGIVTSAGLLGVLVARVDWIGEAGEARKLASEEVGVGGEAGVELIDVC